MSKNYNGIRSRNIFDPESKKSFALSRSKIDLFMECPRCFYIDRRLGVNRPPSFPFNLNSAVDALLKKEFDIHRALSEPHPLMENYGIQAIPFQHPKIEEWRNNFKGIRYLDRNTNLEIFGAIDDVWINEKDELIVVDYKATSKNKEVNLNAAWQISYKRQMEIYQWLLRKNGFKVSNTGYFVYCNGKTNNKAFDGQLEFDIDLLKYTGDDAWIVTTLKDIKACLISEKMPETDKNCDYCLYRESVKKVEK